MGRHGDTNEATLSCTARGRPDSTLSIPGQFVSDAGDGHGAELGAELAGNACAADKPDPNSYWRGVDAPACGGRDGPGCIGGPGACGVLDPSF